MSDNKDTVRGLILATVVAGGIFIAYSPTQQEQPQPITAAATQAIKSYSETMSVNHRKAAKLIRSGELDGLDAAHDWLSQPNADGRKEAFRPLGMLLNTVPPEAAADALDQAADGYERVANGIK